MQVCPRLVEHIKKAGEIYFASSNPMGGIIIPSTNEVTHFAESSTDNDCDSQINYITASNKLSEFFQHSSPLPGE
jgi:hypothetical protein